MTLAEAISAVETATTGLSNSDTAQTAAQAKFDAALVAKNQADTDDATSVSTFNASLDALIQAATAAKVERAPTPTPTPTPAPIV